MSFNDLLEQLNSDADNFGTEYLETKLDDYVTILLGMIFKVEIGESTEHRNNLLMLLLLQRNTKFTSFFAFFS